MQTTSPIEYNLQCAELYLQTILAIRRWPGLCGEETQLKFAMYYADQALKIQRGESRLVNRLDQMPEGDSK